MRIATLYRITFLLLNWCFLSTSLPPPEAEAQIVHRCGLVRLGYDLDYDGIIDEMEDCLLNYHAPVLHMPFGLDWTRPANVDWYLTRSSLRFHHNNCSDDLILRSVTQTNLIQQSHRTKSGLPWCNHTSTWIFSNAGPFIGNDHFFLQPPNDATHAGSPYPAEWKVYGHVYRNTIGGLNLQYWFFYPYNDNFGPVNHEGDWESMIVRLTSDLTVHGVHFCPHGDCSLFRTAAQVQWLDGTHPLGWVADGSHATYPNESICDYAFVEGVDNSCQTVAGYRWFTWAGGLQSRPGLQGAGVVNVGETNYPRNGQYFIQYYSRWGELGETQSTSGPLTPSYQTNWNFDGL
jgi:hypothetical protein